MILLSQDQIENDNFKLDHYYDMYQQLIKEYGESDDKGDFIINPERVFDKFMKTETDRNFIFLGMLKEYDPMLDALTISMICCGGWDHGGGISELDKVLSFYVRVHKREDHE